jgi:hypothetical protein
MEREGGASYSSTQIREGDELQLAIVFATHVLSTITELSIDHSSIIG